ncbi:MAG TPA: DUF5666 domain-containing protein [Steroidobacter sp.]
MKTLISTLAALIAATGMLAAQADDDRDRDLEGEVESVDVSQGSFVVRGVTIHTDDRTDFDDEYRSLEDIKVGDRVEVDYIERDGRTLATEVERDD